MIPFTKYSKKSLWEDLMTPFTNYSPKKAPAERPIPFTKYSAKSPLREDLMTLFVPNMLVLVLRWFWDMLYATLCFEKLF